MQFSNEPPRINRLSIMKTNDWYPIPHTLGPAKNSVWTSWCKLVETKNHVSPVEKRGLYWLRGEDLNGFASLNHSLVPSGLGRL